MPAEPRSQRIALDVRDQVGGVLVRARVRVDELPLAVEEDRRGEGDARLDLRRDLQVGVAVARVAHGKALQELARVAVVVLSVQAKEGNPLSYLQPGLLERGELASAWRGPGCPLVCHDRIAT